MNDVLVYGEIVPYQSKQHYGNGYCNLSYVRSQLAECGGGDVRVRINCFGGDVEEGFAIYSELRRYAKENNARIETLAEGRCASIATVIFLAGDRRVVTEFTELFVHNAWLNVEGNSSVLKKANDSLETCNEKIANHYCRHTNLSYDEARRIMDRDTFISPEDCVIMRFATDIEEVVRPAAELMVAYQHSTINKKNNVKNNKMSKNGTKLEGILGKFKMQMRALFTGDLATMNKLIHTADAGELNFYELGEDDAVSVGDLATLNGEPADGEITTADGTVYVFEFGKLVEIKGNDEEPEDVTERLEVIEGALGEALNSIQHLAKVVAGVRSSAPTMGKSERQTKDFVNNRSFSADIDRIRSSRKQKMVVGS